MYNTLFFLLTPPSTGLECGLTNCHLSLPQQPIVSLLGATASGASALGTIEHGASPARGECGDSR